MVLRKIFGPNKVYVREATSKYCVMRNLIVCLMFVDPSIIVKFILTFRNLASYIKDGRTATLQMLHFIYFFQQI
jgi:hypothetical protein